MRLSLSFFLITIFFFTGVSRGFSQKRITVEYSFKPTKEFGDSSYFNLVKPLPFTDFTFQENFKLLNITFQKDTRIRKTTCVYEAADTVCAFIADGFNHEILIVPGDTIKIHVPDSIISRLNKNFLSPWMRNFSYAGKNKYTSVLFDSLAYNTGAVHIDEVGFRAADLDVNKFFDLTTQRYQKRMLFLDGYCNRHQISSSIKALVTKEIQAAYVLNLLEVLKSDEKKVTLKDLPESYLNVFKIIKLDDYRAFSNTALYHLAIYNILSLERGNDTSTNERLIHTYNSIKSETRDPIRDYLLAMHLGFFSKKQTMAYDSLLSDFHSICKNEKYLPVVDSTAKVGFKNQNHYTYLQALSSNVITRSDESMPFNQIFKGKPVIVDCWATWCAPCNYQTPFMKSLEKIYNGKIDFIYLSFNKNKKAWTELVKKDPAAEKHYLIDKNFKSVFADYFNIISIPRYLIFDKNGKLINANSPRPSRTVAVRSILDKLL